jgi:hypothetical protein
MGRKAQCDAASPASRARDDDAAKKSNRQKKMWRKDLTDFGNGNTANHRQKPTHLRGAVRPIPIKQGIIGDETGYDRKDTGLNRFFANKFHFQLVFFGKIS